MFGSKDRYFSNIFFFFITQHDPSHIPRGINLYRPNPASPVHSAPIWSRNCQLLRKGYQAARTPKGQLRRSYGFDDLAPRQHSKPYTAWNKSLQTEPSKSCALRTYMEQKFSTPIQRLPKLPEPPRGNYYAAPTDSTISHGVATV